MKMHRFIDIFDLSKKELEIQGEIAHQITKVLKLEIGEKIELCDGNNISAIAEIEEIRNKTILVKILEKNTTELEDKKVNLFCAILKKENFELVVQKATECGVSEIVPIITARTVKTGLNIERLQKIAKEASEQSGRVNVPKISEPVEFEKAIKNTENENILFDASGELLFETTWESDGASTRNFLAKKYPCVSNNNSSRSNLTTNIWIGPEGGWAEKEIAEAKNLNFKIASLGPLTLRGETAAIIATYLVTNKK